MYVHVPPLLFDHYSLGKCLKEFKCVNWTGDDISTVFDIDDYVSDFTRLSPVRHHIT